MSNLVECLRAVCETGCHPDLPFEAANRIEELEQKVRNLEYSIKMRDDHRAELERKNAELIAAIDAVLRDQLDRVDVHPCDYNDDAIRAKGLHGPMVHLYKVRHPAAAEQKEGE